MSEEKQGPQSSSPGVRRPSYDHKTRTHHVELPAPTYDALVDGLGMMDISLFADS